MDKTTTNMVASAIVASRLDYHNVPLVGMTEMNIVKL